MPEICRFLGIIIRMFYADHNPPHFHAIYNEYEGSFCIDTLEMIEGDLPQKVQQLVKEWAKLNQNDIKNNWNLICEERLTKKIKPLV